MDSLKAVYWADKKTREDARKRGERTVTVMVCAVCTKVGGTLVRRQDVLVHKECL